MDILVVQQQNLGAPGAFGTALEANGARLDIRNHQAGDALPSGSGGHDALLVLGGTMNALEDADYPYLPQSVSLIRDFHGLGKPVLGICLGAQLIARAFGGRVYVHDMPELGFVEIAPNGGASADPLLAALDGPRRLMQWHYDSFDLPPAAELLATSPTGHHQAFRMGETTHGIQFHFEVSRDLIESWLAALDDMPDDAIHNDFKARIGGEIDRHLDGSLAFCRDIAARWKSNIAACRVPISARVS